MTSAKIAGMNALQGALMRIICEVDASADISITLYDESQAKLSVHHCNHVRKLVNGLTAKGFAVLGVYKNIYTTCIRVSRPLYCIKLHAGHDWETERTCRFAGHDCKYVTGMAENTVKRVKARGERVLDVSNMISLDNGRTWDFVGPYLSDNDQDKTYLQVQLGISSFRIPFNYNAL